MKAVVQRVGSAELSVDGAPFSKIDQGIVALVAFMKQDSQAEADKLLAKIVKLRIFAGDGKEMQRSLLDIQGDLLLVPQFTLAGSTQKGLRPNFSAAMPPGEAEPLFDYMVAQAQQFTDAGIKVRTGKFQAMMTVALVNEGPVTLILSC